MSTPSLAFPRWLLPATLVASLSACMVVPIDPRTGQGYPIQAPNALPNPASTTIVTLPSPVPQPLQPSALQVRLYPLNDAASSVGMLQAMVWDQHSGKGQFSVNYRGDTLQGESTRVDGGYPTFGGLHEEVLGPSPRAFSGQRGVANAAGPKGTHAQCEYVLTGPGRGTGVCLFSDGARYQMHFGG